MITRQSNLSVCWSVCQIVSWLYFPHSQTVSVFTWRSKSLLACLRCYRGPRRRVAGWAALASDDGPFPAVFMWSVVMLCNTQLASLSACVAPVLCGLSVCVAPVLCGLSVCVAPILCGLSACVHQFSVVCRPVSTSSLWSVGLCPPVLCGLWPVCRPVSTSSMWSVTSLSACVHHFCVVCRPVHQFYVVCGLSIGLCPPVLCGLWSLCRPVSHHLCWGSVRSVYPFVIKFA